ncbi:Uncharacterized protein M6B38_111205 [Iris pallida]|uniref:Uncharacterized protein n=1 Tax=Iris pallida TaxID=29817 RepID=A0AAX6DMZ4_IRIPA|nr:Uncharacterized protein M6B38_111205 [Iris pallida]
MERERRTRLGFSTPSSYSAPTGLTAVSSASASASALGGDDGGLVGVGASREDGDVRVRGNASEEESRVSCFRKRMADMARISRLAEECRRKGDRLDRGDDCTRF